MQPFGAGIESGHNFGQLCFSRARLAGEEHDRGRFARIDQAGLDQAQFRSDYPNRLRLAKNELAQALLVVNIFADAGKSGFRLWIVDYFHAAQRLTTMAEAVFRSGRDASAWTARMRKLLKKPNGPFKVLHAAAALKARRPMTSAHRKEFDKAYNYLRARTKQMQYAAYRQQGLPIGSGVTEAACKTVFTQRLKLSGMRWTLAGAQTILNLRVIFLSGLWEEIYQAAVNSYPQLSN